MDLDLTPEQLAFRAEVRAFLARELTPAVWQVTDGMYPALLRVP